VLLAETDRMLRLEDKENKMTIQKAKEIIDSVEKGWLKIQHNGGEYEFIAHRQDDMHYGYFPINTVAEKSIAAKWLSILGGKKFNGCHCKYHRHIYGAIYGGCKRPGAFEGCVDILPCEYFDRRVHRKT
jgi:hypothetical protein